MPKVTRPRLPSNPSKSEDLLKLNVLIHVNRRYLKIVAKIAAITIIVPTTIKAMLVLVYGKSSN